MADDDRRAYYVGFDLGGTKMLAKAYDAGLKTLSMRRKSTKAQGDSAEGIRRMCSLVRDTLDEAKVSAKELKGIGIGVPGPIDPDRGTIVDLPNLAWKNVQVRQELEDAFGCDVAVANDVDAGVYGEYRLGAGRGGRCVLGVFPGTGIGGGCVYDGRILRGKNRSCFEIGHIQVSPDGPLCGCGRHGCLEAVASRVAISAAAAAAAYRGQAPHLLEEAGTDLSSIKSGALATSIKKGDSVIEAIVKDAARRLGVGVAGVVNLLAPDVIVLGGGLVEAMPDLFRTEVAKSVSQHIMPCFSGTYKVVVAELGDDATADGAAALAADNAAKKAE